MTHNDICKVKGCIEKNIGQRVKLLSKKGRNKTTILMGTIESTHPSIFTVLLENEQPLDTTKYNRVSYSYTDILTKTIELTLIKSEQAV